MSALASDLRRALSKTVVCARQAAEAGARKALEALAVHEAQPYGHMSEVQKALRRALRAQARQLGDEEREGRKGAMDLRHLTEKIAYDQWHRLLFARFLAENQVLYSPDHGVTVSLDDCEELAPSLGVSDRWAVAARLAAKSLPGVFPEDDSVGRIDLSVEDRLALLNLVSGLSPEVFLASDSLGWVYQFWQEERKAEVNDSGKKIGADELPTVTQLFTEDYMVDFLLDNTLGAWHAGKALAANPKLTQDAIGEEQLRQALALPGCPWKYLRFIQGKDGKWAPAAGTFDGWPKATKELKCLDPCMGSGHFVVAMFERLVALRLAEEKLGEAAAVAAVIRDNLFGLEIDPRCTQIGAFNLALAAWRRVGHCKLPAMNLACSGLAPNTREADWLAIAGDNQKLQRGMERLYRLFQKAAVLGSLINPRAGEGDLLVAAFYELQPLLEKALAQETKDDAAHEMAVTARGLAKAAEILASQFTLAATNVPFLGRRKQDEVLMDYCERTYPDGKKDLATCFIERCLAFCEDGCSVALLAPQNWLFLGTYEALRTKLLRSVAWNFVCRMGAKSFQTPMYDFGVAMHAFTAEKPSRNSRLIGFDVGSLPSPAEKASALFTCQKAVVNQLDQLENPDSAIVFEEVSRLPLLSKFADSHQGAHTFDINRFRQCFWEMNACLELWNLHSSSPSGLGDYSGCHYVSYKRDENNAFGQIIRQTKSVMWRNGQHAWGKNGVACAWMGKLPVSLYIGQIFDNSVAVIIPKNQANLLPIYSYFSSPTYLQEIRKINQKTQVADSTLVKVPFDLAHWQKVAAEKYPHGLPKPSSSDPTQWLFNGHPAGADQPLHVAVARLLGYQWPRQTGSSFPDCPALGPDGLEDLADDDGIACMSATKGEAPAADRLRDLLASAFGKEWSAARLTQLLAEAGSSGKTLEEWLRQDFFEQHCNTFHQRPFIWHVWDGHKAGFSALINYHRLDHANLKKLTYTYLGDWIARQKAAVAAGEDGGDARLEVARNLQEKLKLILEGEPPYDIFVRWKPLEKQALGWEPDVNDGVRMNIRPFATADILRKRVKIGWDKDRGKEPQRPNKAYPWYWKGSEFTSDRLNDVHLTRKQKEEARK